MIKISEILEIGSNKKYIDNLIKECKKENIIPFIGAGMSVPIYELWGDFLIDVSKKSFDSEFPKKIWKRIEAGEDECAASDVLEELGEGEFYSALTDAFSKEKIKTVKNMAVNLLPDIFHGFVITTNYDRILEKVYRDNNNSFEEVSYHIDESDRMNELWTRGNAENRHYLFKIHGDIETERSLVLTEEKYKEKYAPGTIFRIALETIFRNKSFLFLGCSLKGDRTIQLYKEIKKESKLYGYAFVQKPTDEKEAQKRARELSNMLIHPIWYPKTDVKHESVKVLLRYIGKQVNQVKKNSK